MFTRAILAAALSATLPLAFGATSLTAAPVRVILVGDSTMASRTGYGDALCQRLPLQTTCINVARGGRSSGSFRAEGRWDQVQALLRQPGPFAATYVLIQFGHNDQPGKPGRSTDLVRQFPDNMARYAREAKALGAIPVLVTPLTRRSFKGRWLDDDLAPWSAVTRQVARSGKTALLDLNALSMAAVQAMGQEGADTLAQEGAFDRTHVGRKGAVLFSRLVATELARQFPPLAAAIETDDTLAPVYPMRQHAPKDGWAGLDDGTHGGSATNGDHTHMVTNRAELLAALARSGNEKKIIQVAGMIDMKGEQPFANTADQAARSLVRLSSNTTLIGVGAHSGFVNATVSVAGVSQVIIRNLHFRNPCDVAPKWEPQDGPKGGWNSEFDSIVVSGSTHVWIDHNSFTDAPHTDDKAPVGHGQTIQCHDGALDINKASDLVTVSYNHFALHGKNTLVGSNDDATGDAGRLRVTFSNNLFEDVASRTPRVRFGRVHTFNNYHAGSRKHAAYPHEYSIGVGKEADIIGQQNVYEIAAAERCEHVVKRFDPAASFRDQGSLLNGRPLGCGVPISKAGWRVPYPFYARLAAAVKAHVLANAGAGKALVARAAFSPMGSGAPPDTALRIDLGYTPTLGTAGAVRIYRQADGVLVDTILPGLQTVTIGVPGQELLRQVRHTPIRVRGNSIIIEPNSGKLAAGTAYVVKVDPELFEATWSFRTAPATAPGSTVTVDDDGAADFRTVQGALNHAMSRQHKAPLTIDIRNGRYEELLFLRGVDQLTLRGESRDGVVIAATNNDGLNAGSGASQAPGAPSPKGGRSLMLVEASDLLTLETLTMENTTLRSLDPGSQAETIYFNNDAGRLLAKNANFFSEQDTLQLKGYAWFYRTLVAGNVDFIWGANRVALFEDSEIRTVGDSAQRGGGWLVQARTVTAQDLGFVFLNSALAHGPGPGPRADQVAPGSVYLARSPGRPTSWDNVTFINTTMGAHIKAEGWARDGLNKQPPPNPNVPNATSGWREYASRDPAGKPLDLAARVGGYALTAGEVARHYPNRKAIFSAFNGGQGWNPAP